MTAVSQRLEAQAHGGSWRDEESVPEYEQGAPSPTMEGLEQLMNDRAIVVADEAAKGRSLTRKEVELLLSLDPYAPETAYMEARAREVGMRASAGIGLIHAQIGVDANPCPENCQFCSFAASNTSSSSCVDNAAGSFEVPLDDIVAHARVFDEAGVHLISLMATAGLPFSRYLEMIVAMREAVSPNLPLLANTSDLTLDQAHVLKAAGAQAAYHAVRLGEGRLTDIAPARRRQTIEHIRTAGLALMTGIEPLWDGVDIGELIDLIFEVPEFHPYCMGACLLTPAAGTKAASLTPSSRGRAKQVGAIIRLVVGERVPIGGVGGVAWVDAGTDPRSRGYGQESEWLKREVRRVRKDLTADGWIVPQQPSAMALEHFVEQGIWEPF